MKIKKTSTIQHIFDQFNNKFPYLKLEFYRKTHEVRQGSKVEDILSHNTPLVILNPDIVEKEYTLNAEMSVSDFEKMMKEMFNLNVQVFRKSNDLWLQTIATDHWSLEKQNEKGLSSILKQQPDEVDMRGYDDD